MRIRIATALSVHTQCVAVCCSALQRVAVCRSLSQCVAVLQCVALKAPRAHQNAARQLYKSIGSVSQCVVVCCNALQCVAVIAFKALCAHQQRNSQVHMLCGAVCCNVLPWSCLNSNVRIDIKMRHNSPILGRQNSPQFDQKRHVTRRDKLPFFDCFPLLITLCLTQTSPTKTRIFDQQNSLTF